MDIVVRLRRDTARVFQGGTAARDASGGAEDVEAVLQRFGVSMRPQHPGVSDPELGSYFTVSGASPAEVERVAAALRELDAVEAAYAQPPASPP